MSYCISVKPIYAVSERRMRDTCWFTWLGSPFASQARPLYLAARWCKRPTLCDVVMRGACSIMNCVHTLIPINWRDCPKLVELHVGTARYGCQLYGNISSFILPLWSCRPLSWFFYHATLCAIAVPAVVVCLSVSPSVTVMHYIETANYIRLFYQLRHSSFSSPSCITDFQGNPPAGASCTRW